MPQMVVQSCHAAMEATRHYPPPDGVIPNVIVIGVADEGKLLKCANKLEAQGVRFCIFTEPDLGDEATAIATESIFGEQRRIFRNYQLLKSVSQPIGEMQ